MTAYYNENDPFVAQWLRNLIARGLIAPGAVDDRSIADVTAGDLAGFTQCHFFAGIGGWSHALRLAGWPDGRPVWTGSCPCQPFSAAGAHRGHADERHLWPTWARLIRKCRPCCLFGEQVAGHDGLAWLDAVFADLEDAGYAVAATDLCAAGVGAPHIRQRLYWLAAAFGGLADDDRGRFEGLGEARLHERRARPGSDEPAPGCADRALRYDADRRGANGGMADATGAGSQGRDVAWQRARAQRTAAERGGAPCELGDPGLHDGPGRTGEAHGDRAIEPHRSSTPSCVGDTELPSQERQREHGGQVVSEQEAEGSRLAGFWRDADWIYCRDGKWRPVEPGTFPLAARVPARVGRLRAYGNAIVPQVAAAFVGAYLDLTNEGAPAGEDLFA